MRSRGTFCMEPPVISGGKFKGQFFVLIIIFSDIDIITIRRKIVERFWCDLHTLSGVFPADVAVLCQFFFDLYQIFFIQGNIKSCGNGFQMLDLFFCLFNQMFQCLVGTFQFSVTVEIFFGVFLCSQCRIERYFYRFTGVIVHCGKFPASRYCFISIRV